MQISPIVTASSHEMRTGPYGIALALPIRVR
jgi:hypothetical protein